MMKLSWIATSTIACLLALTLEVIAFAGWLRPRVPGIPPSVQTQVEKASDATSAVNEQRVVTAADAVFPPRHEDGYYAQLRSKVRWVETRIGADKLLTPDDSSRVLLAKSAAERARLHDVGLSFKDVYGIISAETSWIPRLGASKNGTPNLGLAQFEPATARALGLRNPNDAVEAIHVAAVHMKQAAEWSSNRIAGLKLADGERAQKLREGVSIFYNLSTKGRNRWNGTNTAKLPIETQLHIRNTRTGAQFAAELDARQGSSGFKLTGI